MYSLIPSADALNYTKLKEALLKAYQLTVDGFRLKFRQTKCENGETLTQFVVRLSMYLSRWSELAKCENDYTKMYEMILKEQFLSTCEKDLVTHLREKPQATIGG